MAIYEGVDGVNREIKQIFEGVGGVNREVKERWEGVAGGNRKVFKKGIGGIDANTLLMLHAENFSDSSLYSRSVANTNVILASGKFGNAFRLSGSATLNGLNITIPALGAGAWTIEFWLYSSTVIDQGNILQIGESVSNGLRIFTTNTGSMQTTTVPSAGEMYITNNYTAGRWNHIAVVHRIVPQSMFVTFFDGIKTSTIYDYSSTSNITATKLKVMNGNYSGSLSMCGSIDELRISNVARWTDSFTPPTEPYSN